MQTKKNTYKLIILQFVFSILVCSVCIKPAFQFISLFSFNQNKIELNESLDFEDEMETELDEVIFNSKPLSFQSQISSLKKNKFDNYSSQFKIVYSDIFLLPPISIC